MQAHHKAWLLAHPTRSEVWFKERLADGFDVHHVDGERRNNSADNLVLIDGQDHHVVLHKIPMWMCGKKAAAQRRLLIKQKFEAAGMVFGTYVSKSIKGKKYWYFQTVGPKGGRHQHYIGPEFPFLLTIIKQFQEAKRAILASVRKELKSAPFF